MSGNDPGSEHNAPGFLFGAETSDVSGDLTAFDGTFVWTLRKNSAGGGPYHIGKGGETQSKKPSAGRQAYARLNDESHGNAVRRWR